MGNETQGLQNEQQEKEKLTAYYNNILNDQADPSTFAQKKFLLQLLNTKISQVEPKTDRIRHIHYGLRISAMVLSGISTIILGLKISGWSHWPDFSSNAALIITAAVTFLTGLSVFWDTENYWIRNKIMLNKLKELRYEYVFYLEGTKEPDKQDMIKFLNRLVSALGDEYWEKFLKNQEGVQPQPAPAGTTVVTNPKPAPGE